MSNVVVTAKQFLSGLGANAHISQGTVNYGNLPDVTADMQYLGFTHMRDNYNSYWLNNYIALAKAGIKFDFLTVDGGTQSPSSIQSFLSSMNQIANAVPGSIAAIEGPNEINNWPVTWSGSSDTGTQAAVDYQKSLYTQVKADPGLPNVAVYYFTGYGWNGSGWGDMGPNPATTPGLADYDTQHPYPQNGEPPMKWVNRTQALPNESPATGPAVYTETGYSNKGTFGGTGGLTVQAKYTLDLLMDDAQQGIAATYLYELQEEGDGLGLFDANNNPTQAATAIHNLTSILADTGTGSGTVTPPAYTVTGLPASGNSIAVTKTSGATDIVVWAEPQISATTSGPATPVTVNLGAAYGTVKIFDPLSGTSPLQTLSNVSSVKLTVTDHPLIVETASGSTTPPPSADTLIVRVSEDAWNGDAQFIVKVNGQQVGGTLTASAMHSTGDSNVFVLTGTWGSNANVQIQFINDAYGGTSSTDRNLYVSSIGYDGNNYVGTTLLSNGTAAFATGGASTATAPGDTATLHLSEDAWQGNAAFKLMIDGKQITTPQPVTTLHSSGQWQDFTFAGNLGAGTHTIGVTFTNDAYAGTSTTDRNLYVNGIDVNGQHYGSGTASLMSTGNTATFTVTTAQ